MSQTNSFKDDLDSFNNAEQEKTPLYVKEDIYICGDKGIKKEDFYVNYASFIL